MAEFIFFKTPLILEANGWFARVRVVSKKKAEGQFMFVCVFNTIYIYILATVLLHASHSFQFQLS